MQGCSLPASGDGHGRVLLRSLLGDPLVAAPATACTQTLPRSRACSTPTARSQNLASYLRPSSSDSSSPCGRSPSTTRRTSFAFVPDLPMDSRLDGRRTLRARIGSPTMRSRTSSRRSSRCRRRGRYRRVPVNGDARGTSSDRGRRRLSPRGGSRPSARPESREPASTRTRCRARIGLIKVGETTRPTVAGTDQAATRHRLPKSRGRLDPARRAWLSATTARGSATTTSTARSSSTGIKKRRQEWFEATLDEVKAAIVAVRNGHARSTPTRTDDFAMRPGAGDGGRADRRLLPRARRRTSRRSSSGTRRCASARRSPPTSSHARWAGSGCWS